MLHPCAFCGDEFEWERQPGQAGRRKIYCSPRCGSRARRTRKPAVPRKPRSKATQNERERLAKIGAARWETVSPSERTILMRAAALARFTPDQIARAAARKADLAKRAEMPCPFCGDPVGRAGRVKCPKAECHLAYNRHRMLAVNAWRRGRRSDPDAERFEPSEVFDRDGWVCQLCDLPVDRGLSHPHPESVSLDHRTPLALGGPHTRENTQCAHWICNVRKGARLAA